MAFQRNDLIQLCDGHYYYYWQSRSSLISDITRVMSIETGGGGQLDGSAEARDDGEWMTWMCEGGKVLLEAV